MPTACLAFACALHAAHLAACLALHACMTDELVTCSLISNKMAQYMQTAFNLLSRLKLLVFRCRVYEAMCVYTCLEVLALHRH